MVECLHSTYSKFHSESVSEKNLKNRLRFDKGRPQLAYCFGTLCNVYISFKRYEKEQIQDSKQMQLISYKSLRWEM